MTLLSEIKELIKRHQLSSLNNAAYNREFGTWMKSIEFTPQSHYARHIPTVRPIQTLTLVTSASQTHGIRLSWMVYKRLWSPLVPVFPGNFWFFVLYSSVPVSHITRFGTPNISGFSSRKYDISDNVHERFDFPIVGENISRSRTANSQPLTRWNRRKRERERCVD